jgi:hypothetical protein
LKDGDNFSKGKKEPVEQREARSKLRGCTSHSPQGDSAHHTSLAQLLQHAC